MAASERTVDKWLADKAKWDGIFKGQMPPEKDLKALFNNWGSFMTANEAIRNYPDTIPGGAPHQAEAEAFYKQASTFFNPLKKPRNCVDFAGMVDMINPLLRAVSTMKETSPEITAFKKELPEKVTKLFPHAQIVKHRPPAADPEVARRAQEAIGLATAIKTVRGGLAAEKGVEVSEKFKEKVQTIINAEVELNNQEPPKPKSPRL